MLNKLSKLILFSSSYIPLLGVIAIQNYNKKWVIISIALITCLFIFVLKRLINTAKKYNYYNFNVEKINTLNNDAITNYLFIYIFPFITLNFADIKSALVFLYLFIIIGYIYTKNNIIYLNPVLNVFFKYNIYSLEISYMLPNNKKVTENIILLSKNSELDIRRKKVIKSYKLDKGIYINIET